MSLISSFPKRPPDSALGGQDLEQKVRALVRRLSRNGSKLTGDEDPSAVGRAQAIVESQAFKDAVANPSCRWNVPLLGMVEGTLLDLVADLVYESADGVTLVGFDLDHGRRGSQGSQRTHRSAAGLLSLAFTSATQLAVDTVDIIDSRDGLSSRFTNAATLAEEARTLLRGVRLSDFSQLPTT
jgi:hypothetical protein